jgi:Cu/Ag efflux protein CusF
MTRYPHVRRGLRAAALAGLLAALPLTATLAAGADHAGPAAAAPATAGAMASGEVRRVDAAGGKLTIRHGEIPNLEMPPMTMVFRVRDAAMLQGLQQGDKIRFAAEKDGSQYVVVRLTRE